MTVRAKFKVTNKDETSVHLDPVVGGSAENDQFFKYTPAGSIHFSIMNEKALAEFEVGKAYYIDITPAE